MKYSFKKIFLVFCFLFVGNEISYAAVVVGNSVTFRGQSVEGATYEWKFSDDGSTDTGQIVEHVFRKTGAFDVKLVVTKDDKINSITKRVSVVQNQAPSGRISANKTSGTTDDLFWFVADYQDKENNSLSFQWNIEAAFSLAQETITNANNQSVSHSFGATGRYRVKVNVSDGISVTTDSVYVNIINGNAKTESTRGENLPPSATIYSIVPAPQGTTDTIFKLYPRASDPNRDPLSYSWKVSDGSRYDIQNVAHKFEKPGTYSIELTVSDGELNTNAQTNIQVFANDDLLNAAQTPQAARIIDEGGNVHEIPLNTPSTTVFFENADGTTIPTTIAPQDGNPPILNISGPNGHSQAVPLSSVTQTATIPSSEGASPRIRISLETLSNSDQAASGQSNVHTPPKNNIQTARLVDDSGLSHEINLDGTARSVEVRNAQGEPFNIGIRGNPEPNPSLQIIDGQGQSKTIPLSSSPQTANIKDPSGRAQNIRVQSNETQTPSSAPQSISFKDASGKTHSLPLDETYHIIYVSDSAGKEVSVQAKALIGPPAKIQIIDPLGEIQEIVVADTPVSINIPTQNGSTELVATKSEEGVKNEIKSAFDINITKEQLQNMRAQKIEKASMEKDHERASELMMEVGLIEQALIMFKIKKNALLKMGEEGTPEQVLLEVIKTQLLTAKKERETLLPKEDPRSITTTRLNREIAQIDGLIRIIEKDIAEQSQNNSLKIQIQKENPIEQLEQQKAQKEAEIQRAQQQGDFKSITKLQEELVVVDKQLEETVATLPPPLLLQQKRL